MIVWSDAQPRATLHVTRQPCAECDGPTPTLCKRHQGVDDWRPMVSRFVLSDVPRPDLIGQRIAIASTDELPIAGTGGVVISIRGDHGNWSMVLGDRPYAAIPLPLGHIVGSATVATCYPIVDRWGGSDYTLKQFITVEPNGTLLLVEHGKTPVWTDISDQLPYGDWAPGRYALELVDAAPCTERCPWCWGERRSLGGGWTVTGCDVCNFRGRCDPIPAPGQTGWWEWEATGAR